MPLFRPEALGAQDRLYGDVRLTPPISWQIVGYFLFASLVAATLFLSVATHQRVTIVTGRIAVVDDHSPNPGIVTTPGRPADRRIMAVLDVSADVAGLIRPGETGQVAVDAFPYQMFGTIDAQLRTMSSTTAPVVAHDGRRRDVFIAVASLGRDWVIVDGHRQPLRPGMTVTARIATGRRRLLAWLLDPMRATTRR